jgi:hypothetical protein
MQLTRLDEKAAAALARRDTLAAVMKNNIPSITIGLDLGDKKHAICVLNKAGEIVEERSLPQAPV